MRFSRRTKQPKPICGCDHHLAMHDRQTGRCHHTEAVYNDVTEAVHDKDGNPVKDRDGYVEKVHSKVLADTVQCGCRQYIGPEPIQLYSAPQIYLPEELTP